MISLRPLPAFALRHLPVDRLTRRAPVPAHCPISRPISRSTPCCSSTAPRAKRAALQPSASASLPPFRLAPSDFAFLWEECKRCFYLKAHKRLYRPRAPFPAVFGVIDGAMKRHFRGLRTDVVVPAMPPGVFLCEEEDAWVECMPVVPKGRRRGVYIRGMVDCLVRFDDGTYGVIDFKTSAAGKSSSLYARQLHAYARALEDPAPSSELARGTVSDLALVVYTPTAFHTPRTDDGAAAAALTGELSYMPVARDDAAFVRFLGSVLDVLERPNAPPSPPPARWGGRFSSCPYCQFLHDAREGGLLPEDGAASR